LEEASPAARHGLEELRERLKRDSLGGLFEDKPNAVVMHWRGHSPRQARLIERKARALFEPVAEMDGLSLLDFEAGVELRVGRDKGGAVNSIIAEAEPGQPVTYLGDDLTDESAFRSVNAAEAPHLSVLMRREWRETAADVWLRPPEELREFLQRWVSAQRGKRSK
jgi:trehalose-phosphatase